MLKKEIILFVSPNDTDGEILEAVAPYEWGLGGIYPETMFEDYAKKDGSTRRIKLTLFIEDIK